MTRETRIDEIVLQHAAARGDQPTVLTDADEVTGLGLVALVAACRDALASAGVAGGDRVAVVAASRVTELAGLLAVMGGATAVPVPTDPPLEVARRHLVTSGATHVLDDGAPSTIAAAAAALGLPRIPLVAGDASSAALGEAEQEAAAGWAGAGTDDVAAILLTSGSTGAPKAVPVRHRAFVRTTGATARVLGMGRDDRTLVAQPPTHVSGLSSGMLLALRAGGSTVALRRFDPADFLEAMHRWRPTLFTGTPSMHLAVVREAERLQQDLPSSLRFVRTGGGRLDDDVERRLASAYPVPLLSAYGMSEALQITQTPIGGQRSGSVGPSIAPDLRIVDQRGPVPSGVSGTVQVRGATVFDGYDGGGGPDEDGWFTTGDRGSLDEDGWLRIEGRVDDVILRGGQNVPLPAVEQELRAFPGVRDAVAAGVPHPLLGEDVGVVVAASADLDVPALRGHVHARLGASHVPTTVLVVVEVPRVASGKPDRMAVAGLLETAAAGATIGNGGPPDGPAEHRVGDVVEDVLGTTGLGRDDDLFALGATSLDVAAIADRLTEVLSVVVHVPTIVSHPTIRTLAARVAPADPGRDDPSREDVSQTVRLVPVGPTLDDREAPVEVSPILVLSPPRSGSTLLRSMLAGHPDLFAPPELRLLRQATMRRWAAEHDGPRRPLRDGLVRAVMGARECGADEATATVEEWIAEDLPVGEVYRLLARWVAPRRLVDKSPLTSLDATALARAEALFDEPFHLHLVRDPRAVAASFGRAGIDQLWPEPYHGDAATLGLAAWEAAHRNVLAFLEEVPSRRQHRVSLGELSQDPARVMARVLGHLGLPFHDAATRAHDTPALRMTDGLAPSTRMVGDPRFWTRSEVEPIDVDLPGPPPVHLADLMGRLGLADGAVDEVRQHVVVQQRRLLGEWPDRIGVWSHPVAPAARPALFWVLQNPRELEALRATAPADANIVALRSMHLLGREPAIRETLAQLYADEIGLLEPSGPLYLGGNCQGGGLAHLAAVELRRRGREVALLWTLDAQLRTPYDGHLVLLSGRDSDGFNPRLADPDERPLLEALHPQVTVAEVPGRHGQYFGPEHLGPLITVVLDAAAQAGRP